MKKDLKKFEAFREQLLNAPVQTKADKFKRIENIVDPLDWFTHYFPDYNADPFISVFHEEYLKALDKEAIVFPKSKDRSEVVHLNMDIDQRLYLIYNKIAFVQKRFLDDQNNGLIENIIKAFRVHGYDVNNEADLVKLKHRCRIFKKGNTSTLIMDYDKKPVNICCFTDYELHPTQIDDHYTVRAEMKFKIL